MTLVDSTWTCGCGSLNSGYLTSCPDCDARKTPNNLIINYNLKGGGTLSQVETLIKAFAYNPHLLHNLKTKTSLEIRISESFHMNFIANPYWTTVLNWWDSVLDQENNESSEIFELSEANLRSLPKAYNTECGNHLLPCLNLINNEYDIQLLPKLREVCGVLFNWKSSLIDDVDYHYKKWALDSNTLAVHLRTTDMNGLHSWWGTATLDDYVTLINKAIKENPNINKIFIASDSTKDIEYLNTINNLPPIHSFNISRLDSIELDSYSQQLKNWSDPNNGYEVLRDVHMLARLPIFIGRISSVTNVAIILNKNIKKYYCINEHSNDHTDLENTRRTVVTKYFPPIGITLNNDQLEKYIKIK